MRIQPAHICLRTLALGTCLSLTLGLSACDGTSTHSSSATSTRSGSSTSAASQKLTVSDPWIKAADHEMSAAFGTLKNTGHSNITLTAVTGQAGPMELHVTQKTAHGMEMKKTASFTVRPGQTLTLAPGGNHMMFMDLTKPLKAGDTATLTLHFADGSTQKVDAPIRAYQGAKEKYSDVQGSTHSGHAGSGMSDMPSMGHSAHSSATSR